MIEKEIKESYYQNNYPNDGQRFVAWYLRNIYNLDEDVQYLVCLILLV